MGDPWVVRTGRVFLGQLVGGPIGSRRAAFQIEIRSSETRVQQAANRPATVSRIGTLLHADGRAELVTISPLQVVWIDAHGTDSRKCAACDRVYRCFLGPACSRLGYPLGEPAQGQSTNVIQRRPVQER